jgi:hypothetical protein
MDAVLGLLPPRRAVLIFRAAGDMIAGVDHRATLRTVADRRVAAPMIQVRAWIRGHDPCARMKMEGTESTATSPPREALVRAGDRDDRRAQKSERVQYTPLRPRCREIRPSNDVPNEVPPAPQGAPDAML